MGRQGGFSRTFPQTYRETRAMFRGDTFERATNAMPKDVLIIVTRSRVTMKLVRRYLAIFYQRFRRVTIEGNPISNPLLASNPYCYCCYLIVVFGFNVLRLFKRIKTLNYVIICSDLGRIHVLIVPRSNVIHRKSRAI